MPFSVGPLIFRASSINANLYAVTNETYQLAKYGECSVESTETTGESGVRTGSSYGKQLAPSHGFRRRFMRTFRGGGHVDSVSLPQVPSNSRQKSVSITSSMPGDSNGDPPVGRQAC